MAVDLTTTATLKVDTPNLRNLADTTDLLTEVVYDVTGDGIPVGATMTYSGNGAGTLSISATASFFAASVNLKGPSSNGIIITNGPTDQTVAVDAGITRVKPDPVAALKNAPTRVCVNLKSLDGGAFSSEFAMQISALPVSKTIDLEAA